MNNTTQEQYQLEHKKRVRTVIALLILIAIMLVIFFIYKGIFSKENNTPTDQQPTINSNIVQTPLANPINNTASSPSTVAPTPVPQDSTNTNIISAQNVPTNTTPASPSVGTTGSTPPNPSAYSNNVNTNSVDTHNNAVPIHTISTAPMAPIAPTPIKQAVTPIHTISTAPVAPTAPTPVKQAVTPHNTQNETAQPVKVVQPAKTKQPTKIVKKETRKKTTPARPAKEKREKKEKTTPTRTARPSKKPNQTQKLTAKEVLRGKTPNRVSTPPRSYNNDRVIIQAGAFSTRENAKKMQQKITALGYHSTISMIRKSTGVIYRVQIPTSRNNQSSIENKLRSYSIDNFTSN